MKKEYFLMTRHNDFLRMLVGAFNFLLSLKLCQV